ncbi:3'-5' exonuclease, partial [Corynebacterium uberis]
MNITMSWLDKNKIKQKYDGSIKGKLLDFILKLQANPDAPGLHLEPIVGSVDKRIRSARVDKGWRALLFDLTSAHTRHFVIVGVFPHEEAYRRAATMVLRVNPINGITSLLEEAAAEPIPAAPAPAPAPAPA